MKNRNHKVIRLKGIRITQFVGKELLHQMKSLNSIIFSTGANDINLIAKFQNFKVNKHIE